MKEVKPDRGPFRTVKVPDLIVPPARFVFRHDENELVVEGRRRFETGPRVALAVFAAWITLITVLGPGPRFAVYAWPIVGVSLAWSFGKYWARTTLTIRPFECSVVYRGLFRSKRLHGPLRTLDIVGITEINPRLDGRESDWPFYGLQLSLGGSQALVFRGVPRSDLEWVIGRVRIWKDQHDTV